MKLVTKVVPLADLEVYSEDPRDVSTMEYGKFREVYGQIIDRSCKLLKDNRFAIFVIGEVREPRPGFYRNFMAHTIEAFEAAGLRYYNEFVLVNSTASLGMRASNYFQSGRKAGKMHQNALVFVKGDPFKATRACGIVDVYMPEADDEGTTEKGDE